MAIYTQYGRYQKAKLFKEMLESEGDTYMLLGLGNPYWDLDNKDQSIPVAPYDTSQINPDPPVNNNQFLDANVNQYFSKIGYNPIPTVIDGEPQEDTHTSVCKDLVPPFPCIWKNYTGNNQEVISTPAIMQNDYQNYYIESLDNFTNFRLHTYTNDIPDTIYWPSDNYERQFFSELVLRGYAQTACSSPSLIKHPAGLLGAVKVSISFVKDIGTTLNNTDNSIDQFWYGDRYWEVVDPNEDTLESYINDTTKIYPHHLLFSATINPRQLFAGNLNIDQNLIPRQIALYSKKLTPTADGNNVIYTHGPNSYRVGDYIFNFGQYSADEIDDGNGHGLKYESLGGNLIGTDRILNFTFPCTVDGKTYPQGDFKFILNDYIKGTIRNRHSVDRIGYIIGF